MTICVNNHKVAVVLDGRTQHFCFFDYCFYVLKKNACLCYYVSWVGWGEGSLCERNSQSFSTGGKIQLRIFYFFREGKAETLERGIIKNGLKVCNILILRFQASLFMIFLTQINGVWLVI